MKKYKSADVIKITGVKKIQLNHWINMQVINPLVNDRRRGGVRYFSKQNLVEVYICKHLSDYGLPVHKMQTVIRMIRNAKYIDGKNFYEAIADNPKLKQYYAVVCPIVGIDDDGKISELSLDDMETFHMTDSQKAEFLAGFDEERGHDLSAHQLFQFATGLLGVSITPTNSVPKILSRHPSAIIVNLNSYVKTIGGL